MLTSFRKALPLFAGVLTLCACDRDPTGVDGHLSVEDTQEMIRVLAGSLDADFLARVENPRRSLQPGALLRVTATAGGSARITTKTANPAGGILTPGQSEAVSCPLGGVVTLTLVSERQSSRNAEIVVDAVHRACASISQSGTRWTFDGDPSLRTTVYSSVSNDDSTVIIGIHFVGGMRYQGGRRGDRCSIDVRVESAIRNGVAEARMTGRVCGVYIDSAID